MSSQLFLFLLTFTFHGSVSISKRIHVCPCARLSHFPRVFFIMNQTEWFEVHFFGCIVHISTMSNQHIQFFPEGFTFFNVQVKHCPFDENVFFSVKTMRNCNSHKIGCGFSWISVEANFQFGQFCGFFFFWSSKMHSRAKKYCGLNEKSSKFNCAEKKTIFIIRQPAKQAIDSFCLIMFDVTSPGPKRKINLLILFFRHFLPSFNINAFNPSFDLVTKRTLFCAPKIIDSIENSKLITYWWARSINYLSFSQLFKRSVYNNVFIGDYLFSVLNFAHSLARSITIQFNVNGMKWNVKSGSLNRCSSRRPSAKHNSKCIHIIQSMRIQLDNFLNAPTHR